MAENIVILAKAFSGTVLSADEKTLVEEAIVEKRFSGSELKIKRNLFSTRTDPGRL